MAQAETSLTMLLTGVDNHSWQAFRSEKKVKHTRLVILEWHDSQSGQRSTPGTTVWDDSGMTPYPGEPAPMTEQISEMLLRAQTCGLTTRAKGWKACPREQATRYHCAVPCTRMSAEGGHWRRPHPPAAGGTFL